MAIKSKGRTRSRRAVSAAPKRGLVVRKPPIWRRRWVWAVVAVAALAGILVGIFTTLHSHGLKAKKAREKLAITRIFNQVRGHLPDDVRPVPPDLVVIFPSVTADLPKIGKDIKGAAAVKRGKDIEDAARKSSDELQAIQVERLVPAEFGADRATVKDSQFLMAQAVGMYEHVGALIQAAANLSGSEEKAIIDQANLLTQQAGNLFDQGYRKLVHLGNALGVPLTIPFNPPPPAPAPGPSATTPSTPQPSASASG